jgi:hypothetical protein
VKAADLPPELRRKLLGNTPKPAPKPEENEGENLFAFQIKAMGLPAPERQYKFAESLGRKFMADFCFVDHKLIVEISGGLWIPGGGAHSRPKKIEQDMERQQYAAYLGFLMMAFTPDQVFSGYAIEWTQKVLRTKGWQ